MVAQDAHGWGILLQLGKGAVDSGKALVAILEFDERGIVKKRLGRFGILRERLMATSVPGEAPAVGQAKNIQPDQHMLQQVRTAVQVVHCHGIQPVADLQ